MPRTRHYTGKYPYHVASTFSRRETSTVHARDNAGREYKLSPSPLVDPSAANEIQTIAKSMQCVIPKLGEDIRLWVVLGMASVAPG